MPQTSADRVANTRAALLHGALEEISAFGLHRSSMLGVAQRAGVSRATLYLHWKSKDELFRAVVQALHDDHLAAMAAALDRTDEPFQTRLLAVLEARFLRFVELTSGSPHAAELYDLHSTLCGDIARESQHRSEKLLAALLRDAQARHEIDLRDVGLSAARVAGVLFDCAHGAKGENAALATPLEFRAKLERTVRVIVTGLSGRPG